MQIKTAKIRRQDKRIRVKSLVGPERDGERKFLGNGEHRPVRQRQGHRRGVLRDAAEYRAVRARAIRTGTTVRAGTAVRPFLPDRLTHVRPRLAAVHAHVPVVLRDLHQRRHTVHAVPAIAAVATVPAIRSILPVHAVVSVAAPTAVLAVFAVRTIFPVLAVLSVAAHRLHLRPVFVEQPRSVQRPVPAAVFVLAHADYRHGAVSAVFAVLPVLAIFPVLAVRAVGAILALVDRHVAALEERQRVADDLAVGADRGDRRHIIVLLQRAHDRLQRRDVRVHLRTLPFQGQQAGPLAVKPVADRGIVVAAGGKGQYAGRQGPQDYAVYMLSTVHF